MTFRIVVDTREQEAFSFTCPVLHCKLDAGDYSVAGFESRVAVERKSLADFTHTVIHDFARFCVELDKLAHMEAACIVVEADLDAVLRGRHAETLRGVTPRSLLGASVHVAQRFHVPVFWCGSRQAACAFTDAFLRAFVRQTAQHSGTPDVPDDLRNN
jgi:ERCC4-type nuclease